MNLPNVWGQGAVFAFSALDGENTYANSFTTYLMSERLGLSFINPVLGLVYIGLNDVSDVIFEVVASDIIKANIVEKEQNITSLDIIFIRQNVILFRYGKKHSLKLSFDKETIIENKDKTTVYKVDDSCFAVHTDENEEYFVSTLAMGENAVNDAYDAFTFEVNREVSNKLEFFAKLPILDDVSKPVENLCSKCFSAMKAQVYSKQGNIKNMWTTPDRLYVKDMVMGESVFSAIGNKYISPDLAKDTLLSVLNTQNEDGFIPGICNPTNKSDLTNPPMLAWAILKVYEYSKDITILQESFEPLKKYLLWFINNRDSEKKSLFEWKINISEQLGKCSESLMDNSPRFDEATRVQSVDLTCYIANDAKAVSKIAQILGKTGEFLYWSVIFDRIKDAVNMFMYDDEDGFYYDRDIALGSLIKVKTSASFLPLFAQICDKRKAISLVEKHMFNQNEFFTSFMLPSVSIDEKTFKSDMWCGPVWIKMNYMIAQGIDNYGYKKEAKKIVLDTVKNISKWYENDGNIYEFYDSLCKVSPRILLKKGKTSNMTVLSKNCSNIKDYSTTCALCAEMIIFLSSKNNNI